MTEVLLLGTFHFSESNIDFTSTEIQEQLDVFVRKLAEFNPDTVAVELADHEQEVVSRSYQDFKLEDLRNPEKLTGGICDICMYGDTYPLSYINETVQVGYRLAKILNLPDIHAIDIDSNLSGDLETVFPLIGDAIVKVEEGITSHQQDSLIEQYRYYNSPEYSLLNHSLYTKANSIQIDSKYIGSELVSSWYERNLKIYSNLQRLSKTSKRLFVIYGAGHLQILKDLLNADTNFKLIDVSPYIAFFLV